MWAWEHSATEKISSAAPMQMPPLIWAVLYARGLRNSEEIESFFSPKLKELSSPFLLNDMSLAVERICQGFETDEKICIYADFDLDGTSGLALLDHGFELLGIKNRILYQPKRLSEGYGFHAHLIPQLKEQGVGLIITIDVGITALEAVDEANKNQIDVIITDHHLPKGELPKALAVVNPNTEKCTSELGHLCGAGVAFYLLMALKVAFQKRGWLKSEINLKEVLDCFVVGTLTDMVPLIRENRALVKHGLKVLEGTKRPGLIALMKSLNLWGRPLSAQDVAIRLAPKLNALSRMEKGIFPIDVFLARDRQAAEEMIEEVLKNNEMRVQLQQEAEEKAREIVNAEPLKDVVFIWSESFHRGVIGLVATRISQETGRPTFVGALTPEGRIIGSGRAPDEFPINLLDILNFGSESLIRFGGHRSACGFELEAHLAENLKEQMQEGLARLNQEKQSVVVKYDVVARLSDFNPIFMKWYEQLGPFGTGFEVPQFLIENVELKALRPLKGGKHFKLTLADRLEPYRLDALWFSPAAGHSLMKASLEPGAILDLIVEPQWNYYNGRQEIQLLIQDARWAR